MHMTVIIVAGLLSALGVWCFVVPSSVFRFIERFPAKVKLSRSPDAREVLIRLLAGAWIGLIVGIAISVV
jgi:hypothetical protein